MNEAREKARKAVAAGHLKIETDQRGRRGVWSETPIGRVFLLMDEQSVNLATPHEKSTVKPSDETVIGWLKGLKRHQQVHIDPATGTIRNWQEIADHVESLDALAEESREEVDAENSGGVKLSEMELELFFAEAIDGEVPLWVDLSSDVVMNWAKVAPYVADADPSVVELADVRVKAHTRKDGTRVRAYTQKRESKHTIEGHRFIGVARTEEGNEWELHQNEKSGNQYAMVHPETGEHAPEGTEVGPWEGYGGKNILSIKQGKTRANLGFPQAQPIRDTEATEAGKRAQIQAMAKSLRAIENEVPAMLAAGRDSKQEAVGLAIVLIARHLIRIGDGVGNTRGMETRGLTELRAHEEVKDAGRTIQFDFVGKAGKQWARTEPKADTVELLRHKIANAEPGEKFLWYEEGGKRKYVTPADVRKATEKYGFTPHRFRNYYGCYTFYAFVRDYVDKNGVPEDEKARKKLVSAAMKAAAEILNDTPTAAKAYVLNEMVDEVLSAGNLRDKMGLRALRLADSDPFWMPYEEDFHSWIMHTSPKYHHGLDEDVSLDETWAEVLLWEPLKPGDRWVTLKPHGPDSEDYVRVIIRQNSDGTATVVGGARRLMNLRLSKVAKSADEEKKKARKNLTPEQVKQEAEARAQRADATVKAQETWAKGILGELGLPDTMAGALIGAYGDALKKPVTKNEKEDRDLEDSKRKEHRDAIDEGENPKKVKNLLDTTAKKEGLAAAFEDALEGIIAKTVPMELGEAVPEPLREAWAEMRKDPEKTKRIAALTKTLEKAKRDLRREQSSSGMIRVLDRMAFEASPEESEAANRQLLSAAAQRAEYLATTDFWNEVELAGKGIREYHAAGAVEALVTMSGRFGGGKVVDASMIRLLGHEAVSAAIAADIRSRGESVRKAAEDKVHELIEDAHLPTVENAMAMAKELDEERKSVENESAVAGVVSAARKAALTDITIARQKALGFASGSLEAAAAFADFLRQKNPDGAVIDPGDRRDRIFNLLKKAGMEENEDFRMQEQGKKLVIHIPEDKLPKLLRATQINMEGDADIASIKNHDAQKGDGFEFEVPGMRKTIDIEAEDGSSKTVPVRLKPGQIASIQMMEKVGTVLVNAKVGLGKTLIQGAAAARLISEGKASHGMVVVPAFLLNSTLEGMRKFFPDMDIQAAHPDRETRSQQYMNKHQMLIVSLDTIRNDMDEAKGAPLRRMMESEEHKPGYVFGDEAHLAFTPNETADAAAQSGRSQALSEIRAPYMMMLTGTPLRRSSGEVWKILNYLRPGQYGSLSSWMAKYGKVGEGVSAFGNSMQDMFAREIDDASITESEDAPVAHNKVRKRIAPSDEQRRIYDEHDRKYYDTLKANPEMGSKQKRALVSNKVNAQRDAIFAIHHSQNAMIGEMHNDLAKHIEAGERGIVHCTSIKAVDAVVQSFPKGAMLKITGSDSPKERQRLLFALNTGGIVEGGRAAMGEHEGLVEKVDGEMATVRKDDGTSFKAHIGDLTSKIVGVAGTSNAQGVLSAGLNLQGTNWNVHFQLPDSGATMTQRDARNLRTGQTKDVTSYYYTMDLPSQRKHARRLETDTRRMSLVDDPAAYDDREYVRNLRAKMGRPTEAHMEELGDVEAEAEYANR